MISEKSSGRFFELDVLRGLAAIGVLMYHYTSRYTELFSPSPPTAFQFFFGLYGVGQFFVISGFVIFMTLEKTKKPMDFIVSRFSRLYPCYWAAIIVTFSAVKIFSMPPVVPIASHTDALINLSMLQDWFKVTPVDGVYWTLTIELSFYFLIFIVFMSGKLKYIEELGIAWLILMVLNAQFLRPRYFPMPHVIEISQLLIFGNLFFAGILFYNIKTKGSTWRRHIGILLCLVVQYEIQVMIPQAPHSTLTACVYFIIFYLFIFNRLGWIVQKPLIYLGTISYSLYLTHEYIGFMIINYLYKVHANVWLCFILPTACALLIATAITYGVEKPAMSYIRKKYKNERGTP